MERLPSGRQHRPGARLAGRITIVGGAFALLGLIIPAGPAGAATATPAASVPASLQAKLDVVKKLSEQIDALGQQYDALRIGQQEAQQEAKVARLTAARDSKLLAAGEAQIGQIAAAGYMNAGMSPSLALLQSSNPQSVLNQASIMTQLQQENGDKVSQVTSAQAAARRALLAASQEQAKADSLTAQMNAKLTKMHAAADTMNSSVYAQAMSIYQQTGTYPNIAVTGDTVGAQALKWALTRLGDPYVWAAAGPSEFDCSGLTMWAYAHVGIQLAHFTGDQWQEGVHVPDSEAQPGDLVFLYNLDHVGMFIGNGMMVDAPSTGQVVQIQPIPWGSVDGVVRIV